MHIDAQPAAVDVAVIGLGTVGSMALWQLAGMPGIRAVGIEQFGIGHAHGSYAGESRLFRTASKEGRRYVPLLRRAREMWQELEAESGRRIYLEVGALSVGPEGQPEMVSTLAAIEEFGLEHRVLDRAQLELEYPQFAYRKDDFGILDLHGGGLRPEAAVVTAVERARARGADVLDNTTVLDIRQDADGVTVHTTRGVLRAGAVIVAGGSWTTRLRPMLAPLLAVTPILLTWFMPRDHAAFVPERFPVFMRDMPEAHLFGAPSLDGYSVKITPTPRTMTSIADVADLPGVTREELILLGQQAVESFPALTPEPVRWSMHHDAFTPDRVPIIDRDPSGRIVTVAGLSGHGFKFAPVFGRTAAELAVHGASDLHDPDFTLAAALERHAASAS